MGEVRYEPIGVIRSPFEGIADMPIQPAGAKGVGGAVELKPEYADGLKDLDGFSHVILLYHFHLAQGCELLVKPFMDDELRGVFATRAPKRPNAVGISVVRLTGIEGTTLRIEDVDILDGTPLLDIKPYVPDFDIRDVTSIGWLEKSVKKLKEARSDERFG